MTDIQPHIDETAVIERLRDELRAVVDANRLWLATLGLELLQHGANVVSREPLAKPDRQTLSRKVID